MPVRRTYRYILMMSLFLVLVGMALSAEPHVDRLNSMLDAFHFSDQEKQQLHEVFDTAGKALIPIEPLNLKLEEALAKRVRFLPLQEALNREINAFQHARNIAIQALGEAKAAVLLENLSVWTRIVTLFQSEVKEREVLNLLQLFDKQVSEQRWDNFRYGGGLLIALQQWGIEDSLSMSIVEAMSRSSIPGTDYKKVFDLFPSGFAKRISAEDMAQRIITFAPRSSTVKMLERLVR